MKHFVDVMKYNFWANQKVINWLSQTSDKQFNEALVSSFDSIAATVKHIIAAESIWLERLQKVAAPSWIVDSLPNDKKNLLEKWEASSNALVLFAKDHYKYTESIVTPISEESTLISFKRLNGEALTLSVDKILAHVANHGSYHRGQLVTLLRQVGFTNVSSTDLLIYYNL
jgi:uncharacterized damage-inducible protein DinB